MSLKILVADEDHEMCALIASLIAAEYAKPAVIQAAKQVNTDLNTELKVDTVMNGLQVLKLIQSQSYDLAIINWSLPELSKSELLIEMRKLRSASELAILVLISSNDPELGVLALESGASECLPKPFERAQLLRRVKSFLKKNPIDAEGKLIWGELALDTRTHDVYYRSERIRLTPSEFKLLHALVEHRGACISREKLIELVQGEGIAVIDRAVDTHIFSLRKKLGSNADLVQTVRGSGYRIKEL
jgi:two-component system phosphate regulon response regulator PhoB